MSDSFDDEVVGLLKQAKVGLLPTDTIYGLSCLALNQAAVDKAHKIKRRDKAKPFVILISQIKQLHDLGIITTEAAPALRYWPGRLTLICEALKAPAWLHRGTHSLAVRQPDYPQLRDLIDQTGPLISTSANLAGGRPAVSMIQAKKYFGGQLDFYVDAGRLAGEPSTIAKAAFGELTVIRPGAVKLNPKEKL